MQKGHLKNSLKIILFLLFLLLLLLLFIMNIFNVFNINFLSLDVWKEGQLFYWYIFWHFISYCQYLLLDAHFYRLILNFLPGFPSF